MLITALPIEILDHVASALDLPMDLRNLGSTCSQLHRLVHPYHTQFRVIRTPIISPIWRKLTKDQSLAKNIRILEIQSAEPYGHSTDAALDKVVIPEMYSDWEVPQVYLTDMVDLDDVDEDDVYKIARVRNAAKNAADLEAERDLVSALKGMSGLMSFRWVRTSPLINPDEEEDVWAALAKYCPTLDSIDVLDREKPFDMSLEEEDDPAYQRPTCNPNFYLFEGLKKFSLMTEAFNVGNRAVPDFDRGMKMLVDKCPDLEVLKLHFVLWANPHSNVVSAAPLFKLSGRTWASLREFDLSGVGLDSTELSSFLSAHSAIQVLSLAPFQFQGPLSLPPDTLPNLTRLSTPMAVAHSLLDSTTSIPRPLEYFTGSYLVDTLLEKLERSGSGLHLKHFSAVWAGNGSPTLSSHLITRLSHLAPNIEWFHLHSMSTLQIARGFYPIFGQLPHLHTLLGVRFLNSQCEPASRNTDAIKDLVAVCPKLRRLDWYNDHVLDLSLGVVIERCGRQVSWSLRNMSQRHIEGSVYTGWGERGCGNFQL